ncbi:MAG: acyloxyacyl hydrolase [Chitinophagaceae bacterium]|nr:acyloxyacyl hydrolase [Chitinophagaceae bacterium]
MNRKSNYIAAGLFTAFIFLGKLISAQPGDKRIQYPASLANSYYGVNIGYIHYPFSTATMQPGNTVEKITIPPVAVRLVLYGRQFNKYLSAQITYMRPVDWVKYHNVNGDQKPHSVWMNVAGMTVTGALPVNKKLSFTGEAGFAIITRKGFEVNGIPVVTNAVMTQWLTGAGIKYQLRDKWDLHAGAVWSPEVKKERQPSSLFISAGFNYYMRPLSKEKTESVRKSGYHFPRQLLQVSYTTNALGYGVNNAVSKGPVPIFWGGEAHLRQGVSINYQRNIFHTSKVFAFDWGATAGWWKTRQNGDAFYTLSLYPVLKFTALRSKTCDLFFEYSVAGPTFISKTLLDGKNTGRKFTFQDFMGAGIVAGKQKNLNAGIRIAHFSNGNIYPNNDGVKVPLTFSLGYYLH